VPTKAFWKGSAMPAKLFVLAGALLATACATAPELRAERGDDPLQATCARVAFELARSDDDPQAQRDELMAVREAMRCNASEDHAV